MPPQQTTTKKQSLQTPKQTVLDVAASVDFCKRHGIPFVRHALVKREDALDAACKKLGYPLAMKVVSKTLIHKSDKGGVALNVSNERKARQAFRRMKKLPGFQGALVQPMVSGLELIVGGARDPQFGPTILFGLGGVFVEVFQDTSLRICPITAKDAEEMLSEIKAAKLLRGYRGSKPVNRKKLVQLLLKVSRLMMKSGVQELDLNPVMATPQDVVAVDARVIK